MGVPHIGLALKTAVAVNADEEDGGLVLRSHHRGDELVGVVVGAGPPVGHSLLEDADGVVFAPLAAVGLFHRFLGDVEIVIGTFGRPLPSIVF